MAKSYFKTEPGIGALPQGRTPTTAEWNEFRDNQGDIGPVRSRHGQRGERRAPLPLPLLTPEQVTASAQWLYASVQMLIDALDAEGWDERWTNRLMQASLFAKHTIRDAAQEKTNAVALNVDADASKETGPAEGHNPPQSIVSGNGVEAGDDEIHRSSGPHSEG